MGKMATRAVALTLLFGAIHVLALAWLLILSFDSDGSISSLGSVRVGVPVLLSVVIPLATMLAWRSGRRRHAALTYGARAYVVYSRVFLALSWVAASAVTAGLVWMEEPWPLSLRQGPDTSLARGVFQRNFGVEPSISNVYARVDWSGTMYLAFSFEDAALVERIVERWSLRPARSTDPAEVVLARLSWFPSAEALRQLPERYVNDSSRGGTSTLMWVDRVRHRVFYIHFG
jgi:hypothetical protein